MTNQNPQISEPNEFSVGQVYYASSLGKDVLYKICDIHHERQELTVEIIDQVFRDRPTFTATYSFMTWKSMTLLEPLISKYDVLAKMLNE